MWLSLPGRPTSHEGIAVIHAALDAGITLIDTADAYGLGPEEMGHNECLVSRALQLSWPGQQNVLVATKGGHCWPGGHWGVNGHPEYLRQACEASLRRFKTDTIDLYQFHHPDPVIPFEDSVGALSDLRAQGKIRMIGISNVSPAQLELAAGIAPITSVQNEFSLFTRRDESNGLLATCERRGITYLAYSPLGGRGRAERLGQISALRRVARRHHATAQQVAIAWLLAKSPVLVPIPGSRRAKAVRETAAAGTLNLSASDLTEIEAVRTPLSWSAGAVAGRLVRKPGRAIDQGLQGIFRR